ncbi:methyltransferase domain-containing protein [Pseudahrensia aquimaris]|uniref:Methyltransferase domain-containing protein n=1 Tax=Pseudahrensia aquimaris TaxID=744461 RepID=A0ABW3FDJ2_9HYPH
MHMDIVDLRQFYATPLGKMAEQSVGAALSAMWKPMSDERLVGLGFANHFLDRYAPDAERTVSLMPALQGANHWPIAKPNATALVFEEDLPLADSSVDRILLVHALEHFENADEAVAELWRVLAPNGKLVIVVPNRRGVWARMEHSPFGAGKPYSGGQLNRLLRANMFTPTAWNDALHFPPSGKSIVLRAAPVWERLGRRFAPAFAGVLVVEATKQMYQGLPVKQRRSKRVFVPVLAPQGVRAKTGTRASHAANGPTGT